MLDQSGVYGITNFVSGKIYIGSAVNIESRLKQHFRRLKKNYHPNRHLQNAYNKYGRDSFRSGAIELCAPGELLEREQYYIDLFSRVEYNLSPTAENTLGVKFSEEAKQKISVKAKGRPSQFKGKHHSLEAKMKDSLAHKGKHHSLETEFKKGMIPWNKGKSGCSEEIRRMLSERAKKLWQDPEYRKKTSEARWKKDIC